MPSAARRRMGSAPISAYMRASRRLSRSRMPACGPMRIPIRGFSALSRSWANLVPIAPHLVDSRGSGGYAAKTEEHTAELFQTAWTTYDDATYDHSVALMEDRLRRSGFDGRFFRGKSCFDGGCGTGRFAIAMAKAGAAK